MSEQDDEQSSITVATGPSLPAPSSIAGLHVVRECVPEPFASELYHALLGEAHQLFPGKANQVMLFPSPAVSRASTTLESERHHDAGGAKEEDDKRKSNVMRDGTPLADLLDALPDLLSPPLVPISVHELLFKRKRRQTARTCTATCSRCSGSDQGRKRARCIQGSSHEDGERADKKARTTSGEQQDDVLPTRDDHAREQDFHPAESERSEKGSERSESESEDKDERAWQRDAVIIVNLYRPGDGITPHVDLPSRYGDGIVSVSLGTGGASFELAPVDRTGEGGGGESAVYVTPGDVVVLSGAARYEHKHAIPYRTYDLVRDVGEDGKTSVRRVDRATRVSVTIRPLLAGGDVVGNLTACGEQHEAGPEHRALSDPAIKS